MRTELSVSGVGSLVVGVGGLAGALALGAEPVGALVPFGVVAVLMAAVQYASGFGWVRRTAREAPLAPAGAALEDRAATLRRTILALLVIGGAVAVTLVVRDELAAVVGGVAAGVGTVDLWASRWVGRREREAGVTLLRESASSPIAAGRRPVYTLPTRAKTLAT